MVTWSHIRYLFFPYRLWVGVKKVGCPTAYIYSWHIMPDISLFTFSSRPWHATAQTALRNLSLSFSRNWGIWWALIRFGSSSFLLYYLALWEEDCFFSKTVKTTMSKSNSHPSTDPPSKPDSSWRNGFQKMTPCFQAKDSTMRETMPGWYCPQWTEVF